jgi:hypothetical protein
VCGSRSATVGRSRRPPSAAPRGCPAR